eukprot:351831-Chlamydomonas_euryale.AAC.5
MHTSAMHSVSRAPLAMHFQLCNPNHASSVMHPQPCDPDHASPTMHVQSCIPDHATPAVQTQLHTSSSASPVMQLHDQIRAPAVCCHANITNVHANPHPGLQRPYQRRLTGVATRVCVIPERSGGVVARHVVDKYALTSGLHVCHHVVRGAPRGHVHAVHVQVGGLAVAAARDAQRDVVRAAPLHAQRRAWQAAVERVGAHGACA